jgi:hypothetical protein
MAVHIQKLQELNVIMQNIKQNEGILFPLQKVKQPYQPTKR